MLFLRILVLLTVLVTAVGPETGLTNWMKVFDFSEHRTCLSICDPHRLSVVDILDSSSSTCIVALTPSQRLMTGMRFTAMLSVHRVFVD
jgi:hypothetical protein